jgi:outer membrane receptor protein involved in Fe transport
VYLNDFFAPNIKTAVNSTLCEADSSCIPYQVFTYQGVTAEAASNMTGVASMTGTTSQSVTGGFVTGVLPQSLALADDAPIVVFGFEIRDDKYERIPDTVFSEGQLLGQGGATKGVAGSIDVKELYFEASIPVMQDENAGDLTLDLGYRYSDYSTNLKEDLYSADTYKAGINWKPLDMLTVRAGFNHAVRAPTVFNLFSETTFGLWGGADGCATDAPTFSQAQCANTGVTAAQYGSINASPADQYNLQGGGNPNLGAESADTVTFGVVVDATEDLTFAIDYWDVEIEGTIASLGAQLTLDQCAKTGSADYCNLVTRSPNGSLWQGTAGYINTAVTNLGEKHWEGVDIEGDYSMNLGEGTLNIGALATYMLSKETTPIPTDSSLTYDCVSVINANCFATPEWRGTVQAVYDSGDSWTVGAKVRMFGEVNYTGSTDEIADANLSGIQSYFDLYGTYTFMEDDNASVRVGINNILDEEPPLVGGTLSTNANSIAGFYDTLGRFMYGKLTYKM